MTKHWIAGSIIVLSCACESTGAAEAEPGSVQSVMGAPPVAEAASAPPARRRPPQTVVAPTPGPKTISGADALIEGPKVYSKSPTLSFDVAGLKLGMSPRAAETLMGAVVKSVRGFDPVKGQFVHWHRRGNALVDETTYTVSLRHQGERTELGAVHMEFAELPRANALIRVRRDVSYERNAASASTRTKYIEALVEKYGPWDVQLQDDERTFEYEWIFGGVRCLSSYQSAWSAGNIGFDTPDPKACGGVLNVRGQTDAPGTSTATIVTRATFSLENAGATWLASEGKRKYQAGVVERWERAKQAQVAAEAQAKPAL